MTQAPTPGAVVSQLLVAETAACDDGAVPRPPDEIDDRSALDGNRIDIAARIGWLLRTSRVAAGLSLRDLAAAAGPGATSPATLSRVETSGRRSGQVVAVYEEALGLPYGHLRAPIDVLCRTFSYAPPDAEPHVPPPTLAGFSAAVDAVRGAPDGHDWLRFAEYHAATPFGLTAADARPLVARLASEVNRAAGSAYQLRYEALARLRCSGYDGLVDEVVRSAVSAPGMQRPADLLSAVTELPTPALVAWCGELLGHPSWHIARAGCLGLQNMRSVGGLGRADWLPLVAPLAAACRASVGDPLREPILSGTLASLPSSVRTAVHDLLDQPLAPPRRAIAWTRSRRNAHFGHAAAMAAELSGDSGDEPMLARFLFEILYDFRATHVVTTSFVLAASPYGRAARELLGRAVLDGPDETTRHGAAYAFANLMLPFEEVDPSPWLAADDPVVRGAGLTIAGFAGAALPAGLLDRCLAQGGEAAHDALFAAGMSGQPELATIAADPRQPPEIRDGAAWWLREGTRVLR